jgi:argininosuccinate lyase
MALWSGRFDGAPNDRLFDFGKSLHIDRRLFEDDVAGSRAWAGALARAGVLSAADAAAIAGGLDAILGAVRADPRVIDDAPDEDVHSFVERLLIERLGDAGRRLHTGRSRNEQVSLDARLYLRRRIPFLQAALVDLVRAFVEQADAAGQVVMPSYTHLRRAQPVLVAHVWLSYAAAIRRDVTRFDNVIDEADWMPLGAGAIAGTAYHVDTAWLCQRLGFSRVVPNSIDTSGDRDFVASFLYACTMAMTHLSRLAEDVILFTSEEFGFFDLADEVATGSSLMPQKKNPDPMELVRGKAGTSLGILIGWLAAMKGTPLGYNKDYQEDKAALFAAEDTLEGCLMASTAMVRAMTPRPGRMREAASGLLLATEVADYLVSRGVPFRTAHEVTGRIVRELVDQGRDFSALAIADWQRYHEAFDEGVVQVITPEAAVAARVTPQSTGPAMVAKALDGTRAWIETRAPGLRA